MIYSYFLIRYIVFHDIFLDILISNNKQLNNKIVMFKYLYDFLSS